MTVKEYLERQLCCAAKAKQRVDMPEDLKTYYIFVGKIEAYTDLLLACQDSVLSKKILDEVW